MGILRRLNDQILLRSIVTDNIALYWNSYSGYFSHPMCTDATIISTRYLGYPATR